MSNTAITLQCPACGGVFLTLQQGTGGAEICPHCSMSAPRGRYRTVEAQSSPGARAVLPPRRPDQGMGTASQPVPIVTAAMTPETTAAEHAGFSTNLPPVRSGFGEESFGAVPQPPQAPTHEAPAPVYPPAPPLWSAPVPVPGASDPMAETSVPHFQPPVYAATPVPTPPVLSERVPIPPVPPGELPLPSRVLQTLPTATSRVPTFQQVTATASASPANAVEPGAAHPVLAPIAPPVAPAPAPAVPTQAPDSAITTDYGHVPPPYAPYADAPAPVVPLHTPAPAPMASPLPVAYPPVSVPPPVVESSATAKASPAQLWEAASLQHPQQAQDTPIAPTGRELFASGAVPTFEPQPLPPPVPPAPVTFGPLTPPTEAGSADVTGGVPFIPPSGPHPAAPSGEMGRPHPGGTVLPMARTMPPVMPLTGYGALPVGSGANAENPLPPPQIGFAAEDAVPAESEISSPFAIAAAASPVEAPALPPPPGLTVPSAPVPLEQSPPPFTTGAPAAPGRAEEIPTAPPAPTPVPVPSPTHQGAEADIPSLPPRDLALVAARMVRNSGPPPAPVRPRGRGAFWTIGLLLGSFALAAGLHFLKDRWMPRHGENPSTLASNNSTPTSTHPAPPSPVVANVPSSNPAPAATPAPEVKAAQGPAGPAALSATSPLPPPAVAEPTPVPASPPIPPPPPAPPQEEVRRAMPSNPETLSISQEDPLPAIAAKLIFGIESATTPQERARWIAEPEKHGAAMEQFIKVHGGKLNTREVEPLPFPKPVRALPSGEELTLFRVNSPASRGGAILRLHAQHGSHLIDWPLFAQTYDNAFDRFVAANRAVPGEPEWHTVLCSMVDDATSQDASHNAYLRLKVQGSLAETGITEAWAEKNSSTGRYLQHAMAPGHTYLVEMQLGTAETGAHRLRVLDCMGASEEPTQASANK